MPLFPRQTPVDPATTPSPTLDSTIVPSSQVTNSADTETESLSSQVTSESVSSDTTSSQSSSSTSESSSSPTSSESSTSITSATSSSSSSSESSSTPSSSSPSSSETSSERSSLTTTTTERRTETTINTLNTITENLTTSGPQDTAAVAFSDTVSFTTITTVGENGQQTVITSPLPTSLSPDDQRKANNSRAAVIAGATVGPVIFILILLCGLFLWRRHQNRKLGFIEALVRGRREGKGAGGVGLLDSEFDDEDESHPMTRYRDLPQGAGATPPPSARSTSTPTPALFRQRASDSGSMFHEEGVWPPPSEEKSRFVDPIKANSSQVDLTTIVDDIMGPAGAHERADTSTSNYSTTSSTGLIAAAALPAGAAPAIPPAAQPPHGSINSLNSLYNDPFRDAHNRQNSSSVYYYNSSQDSVAKGSLMSASTPPTSLASDGTQYPQSLLGLPAGAAAPKKPSPLHTVSAASPPKSTPWVMRSPKKVTMDL